MACKAWPIIFGVVEVTWLDSIPLSHRTCLPIWSRNL